MTSETLTRQATDKGPEQRVLVAAPTGRDAVVLTEILNSAGIDAVTCARTEDVCHEIEQGAAAGIIAEEILTTRSRHLLAETLSRQPEWSDFPLIVMTAADETHGQGWQPLNGDESSHAVLLERPVRKATLLSTVRVALLARARQYQVRDELLQRQRTTEALRASEERYRTLFDSIDEGFCIIEMQFDDAGDPVDYRFLEINSAFEKQTGIESAVGRSMREIAPDHEAHWFEMYARVARTGEPIRFQNSAEALGRSYEGYAFRVGPAPKRRVAVLFNDITDRVRGDEELRSARLELEQRVTERTAELEQKNRRLRRLASQLSDAEQRERGKLAKHLHDGLQQILVAGKMQLPLCSGSQSAEALSRLGSLLDEAIAASRSLSYELSPPALHSSELPEVLGWLARWFRTNHHFTVRLRVADDFPPVPEQIKSFLFNSVRELLLNSVKHSGCDGATVNLQRRPPGHVCISVTDAGRGFEPTDVEPDDADVDGFGLFSIRERAIALGGDLESESSPGAGARFALIVPVGDEVPASGRSPEASAPSDVGESGRRLDLNGNGPVRVLIVDDHGIVREGLVSLLQRQEQVELVGEAADGFEAVQQCRKLLPDVVLMDVNMPRMNGIEATRRIKRMSPRTSIIGLSFHEEQDMAEAMCRAGASAYLQKGGDAETLFETIREVCQKTSP